MSEKNRDYPRRVQEILKRQPMSSPQATSQDVASKKGTKGTEVDIHRVGAEVHVDKFD
jgi:hypothetical protein